VCVHYDWFVDCAPSHHCFDRNLIFCTKVVQAGVFLGQQDVIHCSVLTFCCYLDLSELYPLQITILLLRKFNPTCLKLLMLLR
jgi:hypothetical protein